MTTIDAVTFPEAWKNRVETHLSGIPISIISLQDLIRNKEAASREPTGFIWNVCASVGNMQNRES
jgi:hypothetical protein